MSVLQPLATSIVCIYALACERLNNCRRFVLPPISMNRFDLLNRTLDKARAGISTYGSRLRSAVATTPSARSPILSSVCLSRGPMFWPFLWSLSAAGAGRFLAIMVSFHTGLHDFVAAFQFDVVNSQGIFVDSPSR